MDTNSNENKPLVTHIFTADPSAHVFNGKIYIYPSHDLSHDCPDDDNGDQYTMEDYHVLSMDDITAPCVDNGEALHMKDVPWVSKQMWAPDAIYKNGKYYLIFPAKDKDGIFRLGIATADRPEGPFKAEENYIEGSHSIDPAIFADDDGKTYVYYGGLWGGQLECWKTGSYNAADNSNGPKGDEPALGPLAAEMSDDLLSFAKEPIELKILDENGKPITAGDEDRRYFEGPWMHKYNGVYYLSYSTGTTHYLVYATGTSPMGPFTYQGRILEPVIGWTTHHSIVEYKGKWYLFYHDSSLSGGVNHHRCVKYRELKYDENGKIITMIP
ncbi:MAG: family 43 glycosylhydrolase [Ruminococcaceae bacterium]|jgi:beta-xylosidase|nr:family 43 glycosylhydrolase [Oscillospiraceae bacterium]